MRPPWMTMRRLMLGGTLMATLVGSGLTVGRRPWAVAVPERAPRGYLGVGTITALAFAPDGRMLASGGYDGPWRRGASTVG